MSKWFNLIQHLVHKYTHHDRIIIFDVPLEIVDLEFTLNQGLYQIDISENYERKHGQLLISYWAQLNSHAALRGGGRESVTADLDRSTFWCFLWANFPALHFPWAPLFTILLKYCCWFYWCLTYLEDVGHCQYPGKSLTHPSVFLFCILIQMACWSRSHGRLCAFWVCLFFSTLTVVDKCSISIILSERISCCWTWYRYEFSV